MNRISGKVVVKELGVPVPDLLVVAYDQDRAQPPTAAPPTAAPRAAQPAKGEAWAAQLWDALQSDRLGSVLTGPDGRFVLEFEDDLSQRRAPGKPRPDLLLFVVAPEDAEEGGVPTGGAVPRILHVSTPIRTGAGRLESYVVRLPRARLESLGIPYGRAAAEGEPAPTPAPEGLPADPQRFIAALGQRLQAEQQLMADPALKALLEQPREQAVRDVAAGRALVARLAAPPAGATGELLVRDPAERPGRARAALELGLGRFARMPGPLVVPILAPPPGGPSPSPEELRSIAERETAGRLDRLRVKSLLEACRARRACRELHAGPPAPAPSPADPPGAGGGALPAPAGPAERQALVVDRVLGQIDGLRPHDPAAIGARAGAAELQRELDGLTLRGGPADSTAFHDFHSLQIAFKDVWERVYDGALGAEGGRLYEDWVRVRRYLGRGEPSPEELAELRTLRDLVARVERDHSAASGLSARTGTTPSAGGAVGVNRGEGADRAVVVAPSGGGGGGVTVTPPGRSVVVVPPPGGAGDGVLERLARTMTGLAGRLRQPYAFDVFAPGTCNFGLVVTYRQRWEPEAYQVGELVSTIPLAPGEKRTFSVKRTTKRTRAQTETEQAMTSRKDDSSTTARAEAEILQRASSSTNFRQTMTGSFSMAEMLEIGSTTEFGTEQRQESEARKKDFREAVRHAAEEYRRERKLEVQTGAEAATEETQTGEISNPNTEITVTYLFYELQRRYRVTEQLHRVRPVVLVAQDVPAPDEIDEDWLLAHEWILRRVLLDESLREALGYLRDTMAGDELAVEVLRATWERNLAVVAEISGHFDASAAARDRMRSRIVALLDKTERDTTNRDIAAAVFSGGMSLLFGGDGSESTLAAAREAAQKELDFTDSEFAELEGRLRQAISALETSTERYVAALRAQLNRRTAIDQLRVHVKENVLYYMQAVWAHEPPDQRFFRLHRTPVPWIAVDGAARAEIVALPGPGAGAGRADLGSAAGISRWLRGAALPGPRILLEPRFRPVTTRPLAEVADVDTLLGFKGNYLVFPLREANPLVSYMMQAYPTDELLGVLDPDELGNYDAAELEELLRCVAEDEAVTADERRELEDLLCRQLLAGRRSTETIIVPTGQLFIEALNGSHPLLEDFKLLHRAIDVKKAQAEVRGAELENLRRAGRIVGGDLSDPDLDRNIRIEGDPRVVVGTE